jgi:hypothetical protein
MLLEFVRSFFLCTGLLEILSCYLLYHDFFIYKWRPNWFEEDVLVGEDPPYFFLGFLHWLQGVLLSLTFYFMLLLHFACISSMLDLSDWINFLGLRGRGGRTCGLGHHLLASKFNNLSFDLCGNAPQHQRQPHQSHRYDLKVNFSFHDLSICLFIQIKGWLFSWLGRPKFP